MARVEINEIKLSQITEQVDNNSIIIEKIVDQLVTKYCSSLDDLMEKLRDAINDVKYPLSDEELDQVSLKLASMLYFVSQTLENVGIRLDIAKFIRTETYGRIHMATEGTVSDKNNAAERGTSEEMITVTAYDRTYRKIKLRLDAASEMLSTIKKVISRRSQEQDLVNYSRRVK